MFVMHFRLWLILFSWTREIGLVIGTSFNAITYSATSTLAQEGKNYLDSLNDKTKISEHGRCWKNAITELQVGCKFLSQETQKNLALKLTDCFLQMSGHEPLNCDVLKNKCPQKLSDRAFNTYTEFYTHTHSICYFLQSQVWQEEAEKTVNKLSSTSLRVSQQLLEAERNQETLLNHQKESLFLQHDLMKNSKGIASLLQSSQQNIDSAIRDFHSSTKEQKQLLIDLFENLSSFKSWAINETSWFSSTTFFIGSIIVGFLFTSISRTRAARIHIFLIFTLNFMFERFLSFAGFKDVNKEINLFMVTDSFYAWLWVLRKFCIFLSIIAIIYCTLTYYDYNVLNYQLLLEIKNQNKLLLKYFSTTNRVSDLMVNKRICGTYSNNIINENFGRSNFVHTRNRKSPVAEYHFESFNNNSFASQPTKLCKPGLDQIDNKNNSVTDLLKDEPHVENVSMYSEKNLRGSRVKSVYNLRSSQIVKK